MNVRRIGFRNCFVLLGVILCIIGIASCSPYKYKVMMPILEAAPEPIDCYITGSDGSEIPLACTAVTSSDYKALVDELTRACYALGGNQATCQIKVDQGKLQHSKSI